MPIERRGPTAAPQPVPRWLIGAALLPAAALGLLLLARGPAPAASGAQGSALYITEARRLIPLDPDTLADRPAAPAPAPALAGDTQTWALSGDGSTVAVVDYARQPDSTLPKVGVVVLDARTGAERARFAPPPQTVGLWLGHDGTRLVMWGTRPDATPGTAWYVVDARDGRVLSAAEVDHPTGRAWVDPAARRLYRELPERAPTGPGPLRLAAHDLATGAELGRLELPDVRSGTWQLPHEPGGDDYRFAQSIPAVALSPDGRHFAVVPADADAVVLVDAQRMAVERWSALGHPWGLWRWLPFWPLPAAAKTVDGVYRDAAFAPNGRQLYVTESESRIEEGGRGQSRRYRLWRVDPARGAIVAEWRPDQQINHLRPAPDGRSLYLTQLGPLSDPGAGCQMNQCPYTLRRLDADTLAVLAERPLLGYRQLLVGPEPGR